MNAFLASIGYQRWILPVLLIIPLAGAAVIWFQGARREAGDGDEVVNGTASSPRGIALLAFAIEFVVSIGCLLYTSPSPRDGLLSRMPSSA